MSTQPGDNVAIFMGIIFGVLFIGACIVAAYKSYKERGYRYGDIPKKEMKRRKDEAFTKALVKNKLKFKRSRS